MKHTQGEWEVKESESKPAYNVIGTMPGSKYKIARCPYFYTSDGISYDKNEAKANAKLIAAAPDLLEALIEMVKNNVDTHHTHINKAEAAIKKATE